VTFHFSKRSSFKAKKNPCEEDRGKGFLKRPGAKKKKNAASLKSVWNAELKEGGGEK